MLDRNLSISTISDDNDDDAEETEDSDSVSKIELGCNLSIKIMGAFKNYVDHFLPYFDHLPTYVPPLDNFSKSNIDI